MQRLQVTLLGEFQLTFDGAAILAANQPRLQSLLAYLLLHRNAPQPRQYLAFLFWPESTEAQALTNLRKQLLRLRRALPDVERFVLSNTKVIQWRPDAPFTCDAIEFEQAIAHAAPLADERAIAALQRVVDLYSGDLLPGCYDAWLIAKRDVLHASLIGALERLVLALEDNRDYPAAIRRAEQLLWHDPLHETIYRRLMRLYALNGDRAAALQVYQRCVITLQRELGVAPGADTRAAYARLQHDSIPVVLRKHSERTLAIQSPFVGRQAEWRALQAIWRQAIHGRAHVALLAGEAGIGKTRLAEELLSWVATQGITTAHARSYAAEGRLAYAPVIEWLRAPTLKPHLGQLSAADLTELARLLPELLREWPGLAPPNPVTESWQRHRMFEALARAVLVAQQPLLLVLDDLQWCDQETLEWLHFLLRQNLQAPLLCLGTLRSEEVSSRHPLTALRFGLQSTQQLTELPLSALSAADTTQLAQQMISGDLATDKAAWLYRETEGNPLFVVEMLRAELNHSEEVLPNQGRSTPLPLKVKLVIESRLARLAPLAQAIADLAATIGRGFSFQVLVHAADYSEAEVVSGLDDLLQQAIVRERGAGDYDFSHDKIREVVYAQVSTMRKRLLHRRIAQTLETLHASALDQISSQLAAHYEQAGLPAQTVRYYRQAAQAALRSYANHEAIQHYNRGLALLISMQGAIDRDQQELTFLLELGSALVTAWGYGLSQIHDTYTRAHALAQQLGEPPNPAILRALAIFYVARRDYEQAYALGQQIQALAYQNQHGVDRLDPVLHMEGHYVMGAATHWQGKYLQSCDHFAQAITDHDVQKSRSHIALFSQDPGVVCRIRLSLILWCLGYSEQARQQAQATLAIARQLAHPMTLSYALMIAAYVFNGRGDDSTTSLLADEVITLGRTYDMPYFLFVGLAFEGHLLSKHGEAELGIERLRTSISGQQSIQAFNHLPQCMFMLAQAYLYADQVDQAQSTLDEGLAAIIQHGDHHYTAEYYRLKAEALDRNGSVPSIVEACFQQAYSIAHQQQARLFELRAAIGLGRFWQGQGKYWQAHQLLCDSYGWFSEGFDTPDLKDASALLAELSHQLPSM